MNSEIQFHFAGLKFDASEWRSSKRGIKQGGRLSWKRARNGRLDVNVGVCADEGNTLRYCTRLFTPKFPEIQCGCALWSHTSELPSISVRFLFLVLL